MSASIDEGKGSTGPHSPTGVGGPEGPPGATGPRESDIADHRLKTNRLLKELSRVTGELYYHLVPHAGACGRFGRKGPHGPPNTHAPHSDEYDELDGYIDELRSVRRALGKPRPKKKS